MVDEWALVRAGVELAMRQHGIGVTWSVSTASELFSRIGSADSDVRPIEVVVIGQVSDATQVATVRRAASIGIPIEPSGSGRIASGSGTPLAGAEKPHPETHRTTSHSLTAP